MRNALIQKSFDDTVRLWDVEDGAEIARLQEPSQNYWLSGIAFHPKQLTLATLGEADTIIRVSGTSNLMQSTSAAAENARDGLPGMRVAMSREYIASYKPTYRY